MPKIDECIVAKGDEGIVDKAKAATIAKRFRDRANEAVAAGRITEAQEDQIARELQERFAIEANQRKRAAAQQALIQSEIDVSVNQARSQGIGVDIPLRGRLSMDPSDRYVGTSLESRIQVVRGEANAAFTDFLKEFRTRKVGFTQKLDGIDDFIRELFGEATGNESAKGMAGAAKAGIERLRLRFNAAGGSIASREDWGFFQRHDSARVAAVEMDEWRNFTIDRLNIDKMVDDLGQPMTRDEVWDALERVYTTVSTRGMNDVIPGTGPVRGSGSSVNRRASARFLVFKDADTWLDYQRQFGQGSLYEHIIGSMDALARDTAILEVLGPQPAATMRFMEQAIDRAAADGALSETGKKAMKLSRKIGEPKFQLQALYNTVTGKSAAGSDGIVAAYSQGNRNILTSALLGGAWFTALGDIPLQGVTARMNGMQAHRVLGRVLKTFVTNSTADRELALRLGFGAQGWASRAIAAQRILGEVTGPEWTERVADTVLRASFLSPWTEAGRYGFQTEMLSFITGNAAKTFDDIPEALRHSFQRHGLTPDDWELIRNTEKWVDPESGAAFIRAEDVSADKLFGAEFDAANKLQQMVFQEMEFAVPSSNARVRAALSGGAPAGTFWGETMRNVAMFKSFPMSIMHTHYQRAIQQGNPISRAEYAAWLVLGMTSIGAVGQQMTEISRGKDPRDMTSPRFWADAAMRGGSLGMFGDVLLADAGYGRSISDLLLGPVAGQVNDFAKLTLGNVQELLEGEDTNAGRELSRFVEQNAPGRSVWYSRLAMERLVFDNLDKALDRKAGKAFSRIERRALKDKNQRFFSRPGRGGIQRAPDLGAALGR